MGSPTAIRRFGVTFPKSIVSSEAASAVTACAELTWRSASRIMVSLLLEKGFTAHTARDRPCLRDLRFRLGQRVGDRDRDAAERRPADAVHVLVGQLPAREHVRPALDVEILEAGTVHHDRRAAALLVEEPMLGPDEERHEARASPRDQGGDD